jgi:hypothetical protein
MVERPEDLLWTFPSTKVPLPHHSAVDNQVVDDPQNVVYAEGGWIGRALKTSARIQKMS